VIDTYEKDATCDKLWNVLASKMSSIGELIRLRRQARGWNQVELGKAINVERTYVSRWENDRHRPNHAHAAALARVLGGDPADYRGEGVPTGRLRDLVMDLMARVERLEQLIDGASITARM
jgi:transcriptional regulator with XRE-family HTH domain